VAVEGEQPPHVHSPLLEDILVREGQLLDVVAQPWLNGGQPQRLAQVAIGDHVDARDLRAAQIEGDAVGFTVIQSCQQALSWVHGEQSSARLGAPPVPLSSPEFL